MSVTWPCMLNFIKFGQAGACRQYGDVFTSRTFFWFFAQAIPREALQKNTKWLKSLMALKVLLSVTYFPSGHSCNIITGRLPWQPASIKFTQCVSGQNSAFSPLQEKLCVGSKNDSHLLQLPRRSLSPCKVWGDRITRAGCRSENWCFFLCHAWSACAWGT